MKPMPPDHVLKMFRIERDRLMLFCSGQWITLPRLTRHTIQGRQIWAKHLYWYLRNGEWPVGRIEHIDGDPLNFASENQRLMRNTEYTRSKPWRCVVRDADGLSRHLGYFETKEERDAASRTYRQMRDAGLV